MQRGQISTTAIAYLLLLVPVIYAIFLVLSIWLFGTYSITVSIAGVSAAVLFLLFPIVAVSMNVASIVMQILALRAGEPKGRIIFAMVLSLIGIAITVFFTGSVLERMISSV
jgi:hypothetical protein